MKSVTSRCVAALLLCSTLSACANGHFRPVELGIFSPVQIPKPEDVIERANVVNNATIGPQNSPTALLPGDYAQAGYNLAYKSCNEYFDALAAATNDVGETREDLTAAGAAAATIMALAKASTKSIGIVAAGVGLGAVVLDSFQRHTLITPYPVQTRRLVLDAMATYRTSLPPEQANSLLDADHRVAGYASLCTYSGIASLAEQAIGNAKTVDAANPSIFSATENGEQLSVVRSLLGTATLSDDQYAYLEILSEPGVAGTPLGDLMLAQLSASLKAVVYDATNKKITAALQSAGAILRTEAQLNSAFKARIDAIKAKPPAPPAAPVGLLGGAPESTVQAATPEPKIEVIGR